MAVKKIRIGHASTNANTAANQVLISDYYNIKPTVVLRPKTAALAEKSALACEAGCNNNKIKYSQYFRNSLFQKARNMGFNLASITDECWADCSSFMAVCAVAGGAKFSYGYRYANEAGDEQRAPTTSTMRRWFTQSGDYVALTDAKHLNGSDYLKRGDVLVNEGVHTAMVLDNGSNYQRADVQTKFIETKITSFTATKISVTSNIWNIENSKRTALKDVNVLKSFNWTYEIIPLNNKNEETIKGTMQVVSSTTKFSVNGLIPNSSYILRVTAKKKTGSDKFNSQDIIFTTKESKPTSVKNLKIKFDNVGISKKDCSITFSAPDSWGVSSQIISKGYRLSLIINGKIVATSDNLIKPTSSSVAKTIKLSDFTSKNNIDYNDVIQIGVQTWIKNNQNKYILDSNSPTCSQPVPIRHFLNIIDKIYLKTVRGLKSTILYNKR